MLTKLMQPISEMDRRYLVAQSGRSTQLRKLKFLAINVLHGALLLGSAYYFNFVAPSPTAVSTITDIYIGVLLLLALARCMTTGWKFSGPAVRDLVLVIVATSLYAGSFYLEYRTLSDYEFLRSMRLIYIYVAFVLVSQTLAPSPFESAIAGRNILAFVSVCFAVVLMVYVYKVANGVTRPTFLAENNYEVAAFMMLLVGCVAVHDRERRSGKGLLATSAMGYLLAGLSLSKSGILEAAYVYISQRWARMTSRMAVFTLVQVAAIGVVALILIEQRLGEGGLANTDRFRFLLVFWEAFTDNSFMAMLFGAGVAAPLPEYACRELAFYAARRFAEVEACNATVFVSYIFKLVYEFGILGGSLMMLLWMRVLKRAFGRDVGIKLFVIALISSLSISGFSNSIVMWPLFYLFLHIGLCQISAHRGNPGRVA